MFHRTLGDNIALATPVPATPKSTVPRKRHTSPSSPRP
jgi:hypothetical protein